MANTKQKTPKPPLVVFLVKNAAIGFAGAIAFVVAILVFDVGNLMTIATQSGVGVFAMILMTLMIGFTFASVQMGFAVMFHSDKIGHNRPGIGVHIDDFETLRAQGLQPIPVESRSRRKR